MADKEKLNPEIENVQLPDEQPQETKVPGQDDKENASMPTEQNPQDGFKEKIWIPLLWPVVTLFVISVVTSFLLGVTNGATKPIIEQNNLKQAELAMRELLPEADSFEEVQFPDTIKDVDSVHKAANGTGYVIKSFGRGYGGAVPAIVAFNQQGEIAGVKFPTNNETPGLGQNLSTDPAFASQFTGRPNVSVQRTDVDTLAGATISSNAAISAINAAIAAYNELVVGIDPENLTPDQVLSMLLPEAGTLKQLVVDIPNVIEAYKGGDGNYIIFASDGGDPSRPVIAGVSMSPDGVLLGLWLDTSTHGKGYGTEVSKNQSFIDSFAGQKAPVKVDAVAGATSTSNSAADAVNNALDALPLVKEAG